MQIEFLGATREVTGSKFLVTTKQGKRILLDCGMYQGKGLETDDMNRKLGFDPKTIDYIILSHAHIDHSGLIPYMYKLGFRGSIITTSATRSLCSLMLLDSAHIQESDAKTFNKKELERRFGTASPLYSQTDARRSMELFITTEYNRRFYISDEINVKFFRTGHMLGAACTVLEIKENGKTTRIGYTGDIGRQKNYILNPPEAFPQCDYLLAESTYGDRLHEDDNCTKEELFEVVYHTCVEKRGKLIIPSFSVGRTQEIMFILNQLYNERRLPAIKVFVDSPLSVNATEVFRQHIDELNESVQNTLLYDDDPFSFNSATYIRDVEKSKALNRYRKPCIIISSSGMMEAGRIKHHVANNVSKPKNTILIVGYCSPSTLGARIQEEGLKKISIFGTLRPIRADIKRIDGLSGHGDYKEMIKYLRCQDPNKLKNIFLVHGDYDSQLAYKQHLQASGFRNIIIPDVEDKYVLQETEAVKI